MNACGSVSRKHVRGYPELVPDLFVSVPAAPYETGSLQPDPGVQSDDDLFHMLQLTQSIHPVARHQACQVQYPFQNFVVTCLPCYHVLMIASFKDGATEDLFNGVNSKRARKACPRSLWVVVSRKLDQLDSVLFLDELKVPPGNRLEALRGNRRGQYSIRINAQYRICFAWSGTGPRDVEVTDYH